jgi:hypothetical protein
MLGDFTLVVSATIAQILYFIGVAIWWYSNSESLFSMIS